MLCTHTRVSHGVDMIISWCKMNLFPSYYGRVIYEVHQKLLRCYEGFKTKIILFWCFVNISDT